MDRRTFLTAGLGLGTMFAAGSVQAIWPKGAFESKETEAVIDMLAKREPAPSEAIVITAPDIAENGAVVPISVSTTLEDVTRISIVVEQNPLPLTSTYDLGPHSVPYVSTRVKMLKTSNVLALVESGGKSYSSVREVKVTIGGCGG